MNYYTRNCRTLSWLDLTPVSFEIDLMAGWRPTKSFAPPLLIRLDSTILKINAQFTPRVNISHLHDNTVAWKTKTGERPPLTKNWRQTALLPSYLSLTLQAYNTPTTSWSNSHKLAQLTI